MTHKSESAHRRLHLLEKHLTASLASPGTAVHVINTSANSALEAAASDLFQAWQSNNPILPSSWHQPSTLEEVYLIHEQLEKLVVRSGAFGGVGGFKLGGIGAAQDATGQPCPAVFAPIWTDMISNSSNQHTVASKIAWDRLFAIEAEIGFVLKRDCVPQGNKWSEKDLDELIDHGCICLELVGTRFSDVEKASGLQKLADCICSGGVVSGTPVPWTKWKTQCLADARAVLLVNGKKADAGSARLVPFESPLKSLLWCINERTSRGLSIAKGSLVITGKCAVTKGFAPGDRVCADFGPLGSVETTILPL